MLIVCPSCASQYELDAAKLGPDGRKVRCAQCKTLWHVDPSSEMPAAPSPEETEALLAEELERAAAIDAEITAIAAEADAMTVEAEAEAEPEEVPVVAAPERRSSPVRKPRIGAAGIVDPKGIAVPVAAALAGIAVLAGLAWQRNLVVRAAPQLAGVFERVGLPVNIRGLSLSAVESGLVEDGTNRFLVVEEHTPACRTHRNAVHETVRPVVAGRDPIFPFEQYRQVNVCLIYTTAQFRSDVVPMAKDQAHDIVRLLVAVEGIVLSPY